MLYWSSLQEKIFGGTQAMNLIQFLTTPNEALHNFISIALAFIEAFAYLKFFTKLLHINASIKQKFIYVAITALIAITINSLFPNFSLINLIVFSILVYFLFKQNIKNTFIALITSYTSFFISAFLVEFIFRLLFDVSMNNFYNIPLYYFLSSIFIYIVSYIICIIIDKRSKIIALFDFSVKFTIIINLILGMTTIIIQSLIFSFYKDQFPSSLIFITIVSILIYFSISMYSLIRTQKLEQTTRDLETEKLYNKTLNHLHDNIRCFKHDFNNIVQALGGYIALNDMEGLREYYGNLIEDCKQTNNLNILNPETINNPSIYSLLTNKYYFASEKGIKMTFNIFTDLSSINCNIYQFTRILGILLDNAIEAAEESETKFVNIEFRTDNKKQLFIIENSCKNSDISTTQIFEKGFSTKERNSGIGLWKVHNILAKNTDMDLFTTINNNIFRQQLEVFYKKG